MKKKTIIAFCLMFASTASFSQEFPFRNPKLSAYDRAKDLVSWLTLEEKANLMLDESPALPRLNIVSFHWCS